ncbi:MAG TPA: 2-dehydropantoate 2-reductase [Hyphomicrobiales bacterium]|nr:2-dehydropantoate 2-reductase [Hyphomicrobiales bacterium]
MKILIMGAGGVGGYYGARFAQAGHEVVFVARGRHKDAIAANGLAVRSERGDAAIKDAKVTDDPAEAGVCDIVLVCTKLRDLEAAAQAIRPAVGPDTGIISLQNGVEKERVLIEAVGRPAVMGGATQISAIIAEPGVIQHTGTMATLIYGELDRSMTERLEAFDAAARAAPGFDAVLAEDIALEIWKKFSFLAPLAGITSFHRQPIGPLRTDPETRRELEALIAEAVAVGRAEGAALGPEREAEVMAFIDGLPEVMKASMLFDLEAGSPLELDWLTGAVCRLGKTHGIATPANDRIYAALAPFKEGAEGRS